jgi:hypothetical protein
MIYHRLVASMGKTEEERDEVNIRSFLGKMIFRRRSIKN